MKKLEDSLSGRIFYTTCRIINHTFNNEDKYSTGFLMNFTLSTGKIIRTIVTCKHCIENYRKLDFALCKDDGTGHPIDKEEYTMHIEIGRNDEFIIKHPAKDIDLALLIFSYDNRIFLKNGQPYFLSLEEKDIPNEEKIDNLAFIESVIMVGYPQKIYDIENNKPIVRKGITATPIINDYNGKNEFLIDIANYHGSSGSPVYIFNEGCYPTEGGLIMGNRFYLVGIFYKGWEEITGNFTEVEGEINSESIKAKIKIPNNLGYVIKSQKLLDFKTLLEDFVKQNNL